MTTFRKGDRVVTLSGNTRGEVIEVSDEFHIDVLSDADKRYRNCLADKWIFEAQRPIAVKFGPLARGDRCYIIVPIEEPNGMVYYTRTGTVTAATPTDCYVQFDGDASYWIGRPHCVRGEGSNDL